MQQCCKLRKREIDSFGHSINGVHANPTSCFIFPTFLLSNVTTMEGKKRGEKGTDLDLVPSPWIEELGLVKM